MFVSPFVLRSVCLFCVVKCQQICRSHTNQFPHAFFAGAGFAEPLAMKTVCEIPWFSVCLNMEHTSCQLRREGSGAQGECFHEDAGMEVERRENAFMKMLVWKYSD